MLKTKTIGVLGLVALVALTGCRAGAPVYNVNNAPYGATASARTPTMGEVEQAIFRAGSKRGWTFERVAPGKLQGTTTVRGKHQATIDVTYNTSDFSIAYVNSQNLEYDASKGIIHPNYNSWISILERDIRAEMQQI